MPQETQNEGATDNKDMGSTGTDNAAANAAAADADKTQTNDGQKPDNAKSGAEGDDNANQPYKPEGIAEHFIGKDDKETIDKLNTAVTNFRKDLSKKGVPETEDGYTLELPDEIKDKVFKPDENGKDPLLEKMKPILHKNNIPAAAFQELAKEFYGVVAEIAGADKKDTDGAPEVDFDYKEMGGADAVKPQIEGAEVWINGLLQNQKISEKAAEELKLLTGYSEGLSALVELRAAMGEKPIPKKLAGGSTKTITKEMLDSRVADEKYWRDKDPEFIRETTEMFKEFYSS